ncbi:MAG: hypothetical protein HYY06_10140 [Deltaproteobacteria bacterium]|nr:hypothetical protein [Deltaproteobacteria bacterium]
MTNARFALLALACLLASCSRRRGDAGGGDGDSDADADVDSDADGDSDGDADPPVCSLDCPAGYECVVGVCGGGDPEALTLDVPSVHVSGNVTVNGDRPATGSSCGGCPECSKASVSFVSEGGSSFSTAIPCSSTAYAFDLDVAPGTYVVSVYGYGEAYAALPPGTAIADPALVIDAGTLDLTLDVQSVHVSGNVTVNGDRPATGSDCGGCPECSKASVSFVSEEGSSFSTAIPCSSTAYAFDLDVAPGTYAVSVYGYGETYAALPPGTATADPALVIDGDTLDLTLDVQSVHVSGNVTVNGDRPATGSDCGGCPECSKASVSFVSEEGSSFSTAIPCSSTAYAFDLDVAPGTYAVSVYGYGETYAALPPGTALADPALVIDGDTLDLTLDVQSVHVSGNVTVNGDRPATGSDCGGCPECSKASVTFAGEEGGSFSTAIPCSSTAYAFDLDVAPGTYGVNVYGYGETYAELPAGTAAVVGSLRIP